MSRDNLSDIKEALVKALYFLKYMYNGVATLHVNLCLSTKTSSKLSQQSPETVLFSFFLLGFLFAFLHICEKAIVLVVINGFSLLTKKHTFYSNFGLFCKFLRKGLLWF